MDSQELFTKEMPVERKRQGCAALEEESIELTSHTRPIIERLGVKDAEGLYSLTRDAVRAAEGDGRQSAWGEVCNVLEGLGYDVSGRRSWY